MKCVKFIQGDNDVVRKRRPRRGLLFTPVSKPEERESSDEDLRFIRGTIGVYNTRFLIAYQVYGYKQETLWLVLVGSIDPWVIPGQLIKSTQKRTNPSDFDETWCVGMSRSPMSNFGVIYCTASILRPSAVFRQISFHLPSKEYL